MSGKCIDKLVCYRTKTGNVQFGEHNSENKLQGAGIEILAESMIHIGYFNNGLGAAGNLKFW